MRDPQRKRVLQLAESPYFGGITSHILTVARAFADHPRYELIVATLPGRRDDQALIERGAEWGVPVRVLPMASAYDPRVIAALRRFIHDAGIELVHTHNYRATLLAGLASGNVPVINTCHGMQVAPTTRLRLWQRLELRAMRRHPRVIACSNFVRAWLESEGVPAERVRVVYNACPPPGRVESRVSRASLGFEGDRLLFVYAGRLAAGKGLEDLVEAMSGLPEASAIVVGDGPSRGELEARAASLGAPVRFVGYSASPEDYYAVADAIVLPSHMEALPMTLIEAAAWGKPAVAARAGGVPEVVRDGETGLLYPVGDVSALREALGKLRGPEVRNRMGQAARSAWQQRFTPAHLAESLSKVYDEIIG